MNKIHSLLNKAGVFTSPPGFFPSLIFSVKSDTNMETKGSFLNSIPSPLISLCSQLVHMVRIDVFPDSHLSFPFHHKLFILSRNENNTIITSKVLLLTRRWGVFSA